MESAGLRALLLRYGGVDVAQRATERIATGVTPRLRGGAAGARGVVAMLAPGLLVRK